jgi:hypothetical protein
MMAIQTQSASMEGFGTVKSAAGSLANTTLKALLIALGYTAENLIGVKHADIKVISGTVYIENDGTAATANNAMDFEAGEKWQVRNCEWMILEQITLFADAAYVMKIALFK